MEKINTLLKNWPITIILTGICVLGTILILVGLQGNLTEASTIFNNILTPLTTGISIILIYKTYNATIQANQESKNSNLYTRYSYDIETFKKSFQSLINQYENSTGIIKDKIIKGKEFFYISINDKESKDGNRIAAAWILCMIVTEYGVLLLEYLEMEGKYRQINKFTVNKNSIEYFNFYTNNLHYYASAHPSEFSADIKNYIEKMNLAHHDIWPHLEKLHSRSQ